jgi:uncharacterized protein YidB (DUF937 family)
MGLFDQIAGAAIGALQQQAGGGTSPVGLILRLVQGHGGGLQGILDLLKAGGLAGAVQSWLGSGPNQAVTADQLGTALGPQHTAALAGAAGIGGAELLKLLAEHLPALVDRLSPNGQLPTDPAALLQAGLGLLRG